MYQPSGTSSNINIRVRTYARELQADIHTHTHAHTDFYILTFHTRHRAQLTGSAPSKGHAFATRKTRRTPHTRTRNSKLSDNEISVLYAYFREILIIRCVARFAVLI